jgi:tetratricopeptide (TPR) repeat protein
VLALLLALLLVPAAARADQRDGRLDPLFERLQSDLDAPDAVAAEQQIWQIWIEFDDPTISQLMRRGMTAMAGGDHEEALRSFDRMVAKAPDFAEAWNKRATVLFLMGRYEDSVLDIQRTLQLEPRHFGALSGLGLIYDAVEEPAAAIRSLEAALEINPHLHGTREHIATLQEKMQGDET